MEYEVERKYWLTDGDELEGRLAELNLKVEPALEQIDRYFSHPARDFAQTDEALRVRTVGPKNYVTYKGARIDTATKTRRELELTLKDGEAYRREFEQLLELLGFGPVMTIRKLRRNAYVAWQQYVVEISLDEIDELGRFVELETTSDLENLERAKAALSSLAERLQLTRPERRSYLELMQLQLGPQQLVKERETAVSCKNAPSSSGRPDSTANRNAEGPPTRQFTHPLRRVRSTEPPNTPIDTITPICGLRILSMHPAVCGPAKMIYLRSRRFAILRSRRSGRMAATTIQGAGRAGRPVHHMRIFFSVGEPSGDLHGANLIRALRARQPHVECVGYGGPKMAAAGCRLHADLTQLAVMWLLRALVNLPRFWQLVCRADRYFRHHRPDAVVLIDYPGFNWWIARRAKVHRIPVYYYGAPQMWAWAPWRVRKMRRLVNHVLCKLPFEAVWYQQRDCPATYVGHPYFDELTSQRSGRTVLAAAASGRRTAGHDPARIAHAGSAGEPGGILADGASYPAALPRCAFRDCRLQ